MLLYNHAMSKYDRYKLSYGKGSDTTFIKNHINDFVKTYLKSGSYKLMIPRTSYVLSEKGRVLLIQRFINNKWILPLNSGEYDIYIICLSTKFDYCTQKTDQHDIKKVTRFVFKLGSFKQWKAKKI